MGTTRSSLLIFFWNSTKNRGYEGIIHMSVVYPVHIGFVPGNKQACRECGDELSFGELVRRTQAQKPPNETTRHDMPRVLQVPLAKEPE